MVYYCNIVLVACMELVTLVTLVLNLRGAINLCGVLNSRDLILRTLNAIFLAYFLAYAL
jgi:hypothetical protein